MSLQSKILKYLHVQPHVWAIKVITANERGCPDILCSVHGRFLAIEVKEGKGAPSPIQNAQKHRIRDTGANAWVVTDFRDFKERLAYMVELIEEEEL